VEVFECCINGQEIAAGLHRAKTIRSQQRERLEHQAGGEAAEASMKIPLWRSNTACRPPAAWAWASTRLCMMLLGQENIRDVILFLS